MRRIAVAVVFSLTLPLYANSLQSILDSKALQGDYNPVLISFLLDEGKTKLAAKQQKLALDQQVAGFREEVDIRPSEQVTAQVATLAGALLGGDVGAATADAAAEVWSDWVDAAFVLLKAGYTQDVVPFFQNCVSNFPYESLQGRCATGLVLADPQNAMTHLQSLLGKDKPAEVNNAALRMFGVVAADLATPKELRDTAMAELIKRTEGMMNNIYYEAAIAGLIASKEARAIDPLLKMTKRMGKTDAVKQAALRGLALTFKDKAAIEQLRAGLKGGMMSNAENQIFSAVTLIEAGDAAGFEWASQKLAPQKKGLMKGLMKSKSDVDPQPALVPALIERGDAQARDVLAKAAEGRSAGDALWAAINVGLLDLGDATRIDAVKSIVGGDYASSTRIRGAIALAEQKDHSGIGALAAMAADRNAKPGLKMSVADALSKIDHDDSVAPLVALLGDKDAAVRASAAYALARLSRPAALDGIARAFETGYERPAIVQAHLVRSTAARFPKEAKTKSLLEKANGAQSASVKFLAAALMPAAPAPAGKKKK